MLNTNMDPDISRIDQYLKRKSCVYTLTWLQECVEYYKSESSGALNFEELCAQVLGQWWLLDLCEISIPSLPPQLASKTKFQLTGSYILQVNVAADISTSAYTQYQQLRRTDNANLDVDEERRAAGPTEPRGKRMIRLSLTDGVQAVSAVEHQPIKLFDQTLVPGCKVLVTGPVISRNGILFLTERNITLLGGEVDSLLVSNALENVVARKLGLPENPDPYHLQQNNAVLNIATPAAVEDEWGDELWEQDLVQQLPEILNAIDASHSENNLRNNTGNINQTSASYGSRVNQSNNPFPSGASATNAYPRIESSGNGPSGVQNAWHSHRNDFMDDGWSAPGGSRTQADSNRVNANITPPPRSDYCGDGDWSPSPRKMATFTLSDSEDELLQAVDVEAAIRMTQMVRPIADKAENAPPISNWNRTDSASELIEALPRHYEYRAHHSENRPTEEEMYEHEFQPPVSRRHCKWQEEEDEEMDFEPQTCFPQRHENLSPEREAFYRPEKPRSRQEAFAELRAKRQRWRTEASPGRLDSEPSPSKDILQISAAGIDRAVTSSAKPTHSRHAEDFHFLAKPLVQKGVGIKPERLESEPMDTMPEPAESSRGPVELGAEPFVYLDAVDVGRPGTQYIVKATVLQLCSGLKAEAGRWQLDAEIADGSRSTLAVRFSNSVLETLIGYSVAEVVNLKKQAATNPLIKERLHEDLQQVRQRLVELNSLMTLEVLEDSSVAVIALTQIKETHRQSLVDRNSKIAYRK